MLIVELLLEDAYLSMMSSKGETAASSVLPPLLKSQGNILTVNDIYLMHTQLLKSRNKQVFDIFARNQTEVFILFSK